LAFPSSDARYAQVEMFVYLCDVPTELGPPALVPRSFTDTKLPAIPNWFPRADGAAPDPDHPTWIASQGTPLAVRNRDLSSRTSGNCGRLLEQHLPPGDGDDCARWCSLHHSRQLSTRAS
jgi:hypothetical protein